MFLKHLILGGVILPQPLDQHRDMLLFLIRVVLQHLLQRYIIGGAYPCLVAVDGIQLLPQLFPCHSPIFNFRGHSEPPCSPNSSKCAVESALYYLEEKSSPSHFRPYSFVNSISSPQQTRVPPPTLVTVTSLPQTLHRYFSPIFLTPMFTPPFSGVRRALAASFLL